LARGGGLAASSKQSAVVDVVAAASSTTTSPPSFSTSAPCPSPDPIGGPVPVLKERGQAAVEARLKHEREMKGEIERVLFSFRVFFFSIDC